VNLRRSQRSSVYMLTRLHSLQTWLSSVNGRETFLFSNVSILKFTQCFICSAYGFLSLWGKIAVIYWS